MTKLPPRNRENCNSNGAHVPPESLSSGEPRGKKRTGGFTSTSSQVHKNKLRSRISLNVIQVFGVFLTLLLSQARDEHRNTQNVYLQQFVGFSHQIFLLSLWFFCTIFEGIKEKMVFRNVSQEKQIFGFYCSKLWFLKESWGFLNFTTFQILGATMLNVWDRSAPGGHEAMNIGWRLCVRIERF